MAHLTTLSQLVAGLWYQSESDYPWTVIALTTTQSIEEQLLTHAQKAADTCIETRAWADFSARLTTVKEWHSEEEKAVVGKYQALATWVNENLSDVIVYRVGEVEIGVYIVGKTQEGEVVALQTIAVET